MDGTQPTQPLVVGAWVFGLAAKTATAIVKVVVGLLLLTIGSDGSKET